VLVEAVVMEEKEAVKEEEKQGVEAVVEVVEMKMETEATEGEKEETMELVKEKKKDRIMPKAKAPTTIIMMVMAASMIPPAYPK
jgi:hypothetical protein